MAAGTDLGDHGSTVAEAIGFASGPEQQRFLRRQWGVVVVVALNSMLNAFMSMNTSALEEEYAKAVSTKVEDVAHLYSYFLFTVMLGMTPGMLWAVHQETWALGFSVLANVTSTWLRLMSVQLADYGLCLLSTVVSASGAWTILSLPAQVSQQRFPPDKGTLTTSLMIQANYAGWLLGAFVPPHAVACGASLEALCFAQALAATPLLVIFVAFYRPVSPAEESRIAALHRDVAQAMLGGDRSARIESVEQPPRGLENGAALSPPDGSFRQLLRVCVTRPSFAMLVLASGLLGGISFALPSASVAILEHFGFPESVIALVNIAFIGTGVLSGLVFGKMCSDPRSYEACMKALFACSVICLCATAWMANTGLLERGLHHRLHFLVFMLLSAASGMSSIGFIGIGVQAAALYPVGPSYACWAIEIIVQGIGGGLNFWAMNKDGFDLLAAAACAAGILLCLSYRVPVRDRATLA